MKGMIVCFFALLFTAQFADAHSSCDNNFGENIEDLTEQRRVTLINKWVYEKNYEGDLNGDGIEDRIFVFKLNNTAKFNKDVILVDPPVFDDMAKKYPGGKFVLPKKLSYALGVVQSTNTDNVCQKFIIYSTYFSTLHDKGTFVAAIRHTDDRGYDLFAKSEGLSKKLKNDFILLRIDGREGVLHWDGKKYKLEFPFADVTKLDYGE